MVVVAPFPSRPESCASGKRGRRQVLALACYRISPHGVKSHLHWLQCMVLGAPSRTVALLLHVGFGHVNFSSGFGLLEASGNGAAAAAGDAAAGAGACFGVPSSRRIPLAMPSAIDFSFFNHVKPPPLESRSRFSAWQMASNAIVVKGARKTR